MLFRSDVRRVFDRLLNVEEASPIAYEKATREILPRYRAIYEGRFAEHRLEAVILPTTPMPASPVGQDETVWLLGQSVSTFLTYTRNTTLATVLGTPGISMPMGMTSAGLPMGIELDGARGSDRRLLSIALAIESLLPRLPPPASNA